MSWLDGQILQNCFHLGDDLVVIKTANLFQDLFPSKSDFVKTSSSPGFMSGGHARCHLVVDEVQEIRLRKEQMMYEASG